MSIVIDREELLKEKLLTGITLFTGAGFACLPDSNSIRLPTVHELCLEICNRFDTPEEFAEDDDLESISAINDGPEFQNFLRERFTVKEYNTNYNLLNRLSLKAYITTNIDNIIHLAIENGKKYFLKSLTYYGASRRDAAELCYIPLHGEVMNIESHLYFGKFDLAIVDDANRDLFRFMQTSVNGQPILFWGYGFHDGGVLKIVKKMLDSGPQDIWIQCMPDNKKQIELFKTLGCNIIISDTTQLFSWIEKNIPEKEPEVFTDVTLNPNLKKYSIPTIGQVTVVPFEDYYIRGNTQWYSILSKQAIELDIVNDLYNSSLAHKNVVAVGTDFSGKTTALMQAALKIDAPNKLYFSSIIPEKAKYILSQLQDRQATIFIDNCSSDMEACRILSVAPNVKTIAVSSDYAFESSKHLLEDDNYYRLLIGELTKPQAK